MKTIYLNGVVGYEITADKIREQVNFESKEKMRIIVNSNGGFVTDAFEIYNLLNTYKGEIEAVIMGVAASAMSYIIMAADTISAFKNSIFMAHLSQTIAIGDADSLLRESMISRAMDNIIAEAYTKKFKKKKEDILAEMKNEIWLVGWEALTESGIIDNIIDNPEEIEIPEIGKDDERLIFLFSDNIDMMAEKAKAQLKLMQIENKMRKDDEKIKTYSARAASITEKQLINFHTDKNQSENKNNMEDQKMEFEEYLKSNPKAKAEYDLALQTAEAKGKESAKGEQTAEIIEERKRIKEILDISSVNLSEVAKTALDDGLSAGDYAKEEMKAQKALRVKPAENIFGKISSAQLPGDQDIKTAAETEVEKSIEDFDKILDAKLEEKTKRRIG